MHSSRRADAAGFCRRLVVLAGLAAAIGGTALVRGAEADPRAAGAPLEIGTRWELFVDHFLIESARGAALKLHEPRRAEVVLVLDAPWEGPTSAYFAVLRDGDVIRLYSPRLGRGVGSFGQPSDVRGRKPRRHPFHAA
jgi:hypothetical protein